MTLFPHSLYIFYKHLCYITECEDTFFLCIKVHPITDNEGPEGDQRYSSTLSLTSALNGGG